MNDMTLSPEAVARARIGQHLSQYDRIALVFQGGGALGAYQVGVYHALSEFGCEPNWLSGVSIGAVNAAIIAGNAPEDRLAKLREFWEIISARKIWLYTPEGDFFRELRNHSSAMMTMALGQPGFFKPWPIAPWLQLRGALAATSYYDTGPLEETLRRVIDFDRLNSGAARLSVGAVNVRSGNFIYFDTAEHRLGPEHIMASGALPPALPAVKIDGEYYWDGGIVSNTPLRHLLEQEEGHSTLVFSVDLFSARGSLPRDIRDVLGRHKDIMYSSRTRANTDNFRKLHALRQQYVRTISKLPEDQRDAAEVEFLRCYADAPQINIVHLIYQQKSYEGHAKDYEFSGTSMREHWQAGYDDTRRTLRHPEWLAAPLHEGAIVVHDLHRDDDK
jgi:NTE family protein